MVPSPNQLATTWEGNQLGVFFFYCFFGFGGFCLVFNRFGSSLELVGSSQNVPGLKPTVFIRLKQVPLNTSLKLVQILLG